MDCPFCNVNLERNPVLKEGKYTIAILSNPRLMSGHILIIPRRHAEKISELKKEELDELFQLIIEFQEKILDKIAPGCDIRQHYRPFQKQGRLKVDHLHFHLQPRELSDELYEKCQVFEKDIFKDLPKEEMTRMIEILSR